MQTTGQRTLETSAETDALWQLVDLVDGRCLVAPADYDIERIKEDDLAHDGQIRRYRTRADAEASITRGRHEVLDIWGR